MGETLTRSLSCSGDACCSCAKKPGDEYDVAGSCASRGGVEMPASPTMTHPPVLQESIAVNQMEQVTLPKRCDGKTNPPFVVTALKKDYDFREIDAFEKEPKNPKLEPPENYKQARKAELRQVVTSFQSQTVEDTEQENPEDPADPFFQMIKAVAWEDPGDQKIANGSNTSEEADLQQLRRRRLMENKSEAKKRSQERSFATPLEDLSNSEKIASYRERYEAIKEAILSCSEVSPVKVIPEQDAFQFYLSQSGRAAIDEVGFIDLMERLVEFLDLSRQISKRDIDAMFKVLDFDETGILEYYQWVSALPLFFNGSVDLSAEIFRCLDTDCSGELSFEEFENYTTTVVHMIVPPDDLDLRDRLRKRLTWVIFKLIDSDTGCTISPAEWDAWSQRPENSLEIEALKALEECVNDPLIHLQTESAITEILSPKVQSPPTETHFKEEKKMSPSKKNGYMKSIGSSVKNRFSILMEKSPKKSVKNDPPTTANLEEDLQQLLRKHSQEIQSLVESHSPKRGRGIAAPNGLSLS